MNHLNLSAQNLYHHAIQNGEVKRASDSGAIAAYTGKRTARSAADRYIVEDSKTLDKVAWGPINQPYPYAHYDNLFNLVKQHLDNQEQTFEGSYHVGAHEEHYLPVTVKTTHAWHQLFAHHLFINPENHNPKQKNTWTIWHAPDLMLDAEVHHCNSEAIILLNFTKRTVLIAGTHYAGEIKKAMFSVLNYILPQEDILPMHCAANQGSDGNTTVFFGLSGTGKTTLSSDPDRFLIGDDEHGWSQNSVFNFEGGCYAKTIKLSAEHEPLIYQAIRNPAVLENVPLDTAGIPDYNDDCHTKNTRAGYPREHIEKRVAINQGQPPNAVVFLSCDLFGVLPPISLLTPDQAIYYFLNGYTAKVGSTEVGSTAEVQPTFSHCFGAPFFPLPVSQYARLLSKRLQETNAKVYLVNTGWMGGQYGQGGTRYAIPTTRTIISAIVSGQVNWNETQSIIGLNMTIPTSLPGLDDYTLLDPRNAWDDKQAYYQTANNLATLFQDNIKQYEGQISKQVIESGPCATQEIYNTSEF
jgi:phosphoenolpyruvate carboxykinase (ATP)